MPLLIAAYVYIKSSKFILTSARLPLYKKSVSGRAKAKFFDRTPKNLGIGLKYLFAARDLALFITVAK